MITTDSFRNLFYSDSLQDGKGTYHIYSLIPSKW